MTDPTPPSIRCNHARLQHLHIPHRWAPQPGMDPVHCPGYPDVEPAPAAGLGPAESGDVDNSAGPDSLREEIRRVLTTTSRTDWPPPSPHGGPDGHLYDIRCALCGSDVDALVEALATVRDAELARTRTLLRSAEQLRRESHEALGAVTRRAEQAEAERDRLRAELAKLRAVDERGYCPRCGRGDCAPTVGQWEHQRDRAEQAEVERDQLRGEITATVARLADMAKIRADQDGAELVRLRDRVVELEARDEPSWRQRAEQAEAAIARVRAIPREPHESQQAEGLGRAYTRGWESVISAINTALDPSNGAAHVYLSTSCLHGLHLYCQQETGVMGDKIPAQCKFCAAHCVCSCHQQPTDPDDD